MIEIFVQTLPFFALIALGYGAARIGFFNADATAYLTKFVFYFALTAMILRFSANLPLAEVFDGQLVLAYLCATTTVFMLVSGMALLRGIGIAEAVVEGQVSIIGNIGFLGLPMLGLLLGEASVGPMILIIAVDMMVFSSAIIVIITAAKQGAVSLRIFKSVAIGLLKNPMIMSIFVGFAYAATGWSIAAPINNFLALLGAAATPCALFAIGASLATKSAERLTVAVWLSFGKLFLHPLAVGIAALWVFRIEPFTAGVMIAAAALPVAGNVYILAQHYGVAPQRVSASILVSTIISVVTVSVVVGWVAGI